MLQVDRNGYEYELDEFTLTDEQVENWRRVLSALPIGMYARVVPREQIVEMARRIQSKIDKMEEDHMLLIRQGAISSVSSNLIRTRPRRLKVDQFGNTKPIRIR